MALLIVSILVLLAALVLALWGRKRLAREDGMLTQAEQARDTARALVESGQAVQKETVQERELAGALLAHVQKLEDSLVNPRFALDLKIGRIRALRYNEAPVPSRKSRPATPTRIAGSATAAAGTAGRVRLAWLSPACAFGGGAER